MDKEVIVCAAIKLEDGTIFAGPRHCHCVGYAIAALGKSEDTKLKTMRSDMNGFLTNYNRWVNREEAYNIAEANGQLKERGMDDCPHRILFSEDLY